MENLLVAQHRHLNTGFWPASVQDPGFAVPRKEGLERAPFWLEKVGLEDGLANRAAATWPGQQRRLEIARCMYPARSC